MIRIRNISLAIAAAVVISLLLGVIWFYGAIVSMAVTGIDRPLQGADRSLYELFFHLGILGVFYPLLPLPVLLWFQFYRVLASGDLWGGLRRRLRLFLILFLIGFGLGQCLWLSGILLA